MLSGALTARSQQNVLGRIVSSSRPNDTAQSLLYQRFSHLWSPSKMRWSSQSSTSAPFSYRLGASSCSKKSKLRPQENGKTEFNASLLSRDPSYFNSAPRHSGEDAFFMAHIAKSNRYVAFGIADGVGGWTESGVDPGEFSHGLCRYMAEKTYRPVDIDDLRPQRLLQHGYDRVQEDTKIEAGGSTACIAAIQPNGSLEVANLGDSGYILLRPQKIAYASRPQTHAFNTPYQLSKLTPRMRAQNAIFGNSAAISESPKDADVTTQNLAHGDVLVFGSDGVWDNLSAMDTLNLLTPIMEKKGYWDNGQIVADAIRPSRESEKEKATAVEQLPSDLAYAVMRASKLAGMDTRRDGPFAREVQRYYPGEDWHGGKHDDIAVIVVLVVQDALEGPVKAKL